LNASPNSSRAEDTATLDIVVGWDVAFFEAALIAAMVIPVVSGHLGCDQQNSRTQNLLS